MITINIDYFNSKTDVSQNFYDNIINKLNLNSLMCPCGSHDLVKHAHYTRGVKTAKGKIRINVLRVKCNSCGKTHALLLSNIVPYQIVQLPDQIRIIEDDDIEGLMITKPDIDENDVYRIKRRYKEQFKELLISFKLKIDKDIVVNSFKYFKKQFMQASRNKCPLNVLSLAIHIT